MKKLFVTIVLLSFVGVPTTLYAQKNTVSGAMIIHNTDIIKTKRVKEKKVLTDEEIARKAEEEARLAAEREKKAEERKNMRKERAENRKGRFFLSFNLAMPYMKYPDALSYGFMAGWGGKLLGGYVKGVFGDGISDYSGVSNSRDGCFGYINHNVKQLADASYNAVSGGLLLRMGCPLHLYAGAGASWREVAYCNAVDGRLYLVADKSVTTVCVDFGLMLKLKWFNLSAGSIYTPKQGFVGNVGIGLCF